MALQKISGERQGILLDVESKSNYARRMNELLSWTLPIGAALACIALAFNALQVISSEDEFWIARLWFVVAALILLARFIIWGVTTNRSVTLRLVLCFIACGGVTAFAIEAVRYVNRKSERWKVVSHNPATRISANQSTEGAQRAPEQGAALTPAEARALPKRAAELECRSARTQIMFMFPDGALSDHKRDYQEREIEAALVKFRRKPDDIAMTSIDVRASMDFYDLNNASRHQIDGGLWVKKETKTITFRVGVAEGLIIAVRGDIAFAYDGSYEGDDLFNRARRFIANFEELTEQQYRVEIGLIGTRGGVTLLAQTFNFTLTTEPNLKIEPYSPVEAQSVIATPSESQATHEYKIERLKEYIRENSQGGGGEITRERTMARLSRNSNVASFLEQYFDVSHAQRFKEQGYSFLEELLKDLLEK